jgi:hypothetical protein
VNALLLEITNISETRDRSVVRFSVIPSAKYCWSGSLLRLAKGSTTIDRCGATSGAEIATAVGVEVVDVIKPVACTAGLPAREKKSHAGQSHHTRDTMTSVAAAAMPTMTRPRQDGLDDC